MPEWLPAVIAFLSSGVISGILKLYFDYQNEKLIINEKKINDRINIWQEINEKSEIKIIELDKKLKSYECDFRSLHRYIAELERIIARVAPDAELPQMPILENS